MSLIRLAISTEMVRLIDIYTLLGITMGTIALNLFDKDVDSLDHPRVKEFLENLKKMADVYRCQVVRFAIDKGVVIFNIDNEEMCNDILNDLKELTDRKPYVASDSEEFVDIYKKFYRE